MPTYTDSAKNTGTDAVNALVDGGDLRILAGATVLGTFTLSSPAFASASSGTASLNIPSSVSAGADGTADSYELRDSGGTVQMSGTAGDTGSEECVLSNATVQTGQDLTVNSFTHAALG